MLTVDFIHGLVNWYKRSKHTWLTVLGRSWNKNEDLKSRIDVILPIALSVILPGIVLYANQESPRLEDLGVFKRWLIASVFMYLMWYQLWYLWDANSGKKRYWVFLALVVFLATVYTSLRLSDSSVLDGMKWFYLFRFMMGCVMFLTIQYSLITQRTIMGLQLEKGQIQTENYRAQLKALRSQVDPHFLFNSLNTLRSMVRQQHANSEKFIMSLSDFYRQTLKHNENTTLPLEEELAVLESYLFLMKSRNDEAVSVTIEADPALHQRHLPTLALQVMVENCFKHNSMTTRSPLKIQVHTVEDNYIEVRNNIQPKIGDESSSGRGLDLLRKRYALMDVPDAVIVSETDEHFSVKLKLI